MVSTNRQTLIGYILRSWMSEHGHKTISAAHQIGTADHTLNSWLRGDHTPSPANQTMIALAICADQPTINILACKSLLRACANFDLQHKGKQT